MNNAPNNQPPNTPPKNNKQQISEAEKNLPTPTTRKYSLIILLLVLLLVTSTTAAAYFYLNPRGNISPTETPSNDVPTGTSQPTLQPSEAPAKEATANWETYVTSTYAIKYPPTMESEEQPGDTLRLTLHEPSQHQNNLTDDLILRFQPKELSVSAEEYAQNQITQSQQAGTGEVIQPPTNITVNGYQATTYTTRGLGESQYIILEGSNNTLLEIVVATADPNNIGYQQTVDQILSTLEFLPDTSTASQQVSGYLKSLSQQNGQYHLEINPVEFLKDSPGNPTASQAYVDAGNTGWDCQVQNGQVLEPCIPNGYYIKDPNPRTQTYPAHTSLDQVTLAMHHQIDSQALTPYNPIPFSQFTNLYQPNNSLGRALWHLSLKDGQVTAIKQQYLP